MLITISGPQSSGKSTVLEYIRKNYPTVPIIPETNPFTVIEKNHLGGAHITPQQEELILEKDIEIIQSIDRTLPLIVFECGIMHMMYAEEQFSSLETQDYYDRFLAAHNGLEMVVIFIDTTPVVSWKRRKKTYEQRLAKKGIIDKAEISKFMEKYRATIFNRYPLWMKWFHKLPYKKMIIENNHNSESKFLAEFKKIFDSLVI